MRMNCIKEKRFRNFKDIYMENTIYYWLDKNIKDWDENYFICNINIDKEYYICKNLFIKISIKKCKCIDETIIEDIKTISNIFNKKYLLVLLNMKHQQN